MRKNYSFFIFGAGLCLFAVAFIIFAVTHPELSFPWPNWVTYTIYVLYAIYTIMVFCMPRFKGASMITCFILAMELGALCCFAISIGLRKTSGQSNWYLPAGLIMVNIGNFTNVFVSRKNKKTK